MLFRRTISFSTKLRSDLIQQAFINKVKEFGQIGSDLANKDPNVKKALQDELNRVGQKYHLGTDSVSKLPLTFTTPKVESSFTAAYEGVSVSQLLEEVKKEEKIFTEQQAKRRAEEAKRAAVDAKN